MSYGYNSTVAFSLSTATIDDFAIDLLDRLANKRTRNEEKRRPLMFICHSLGGVVVKSALCHDYQLHSGYGDVINATRGIVFMGTPHRGSLYARPVHTISKITNFFGPAGISRSDLLKVLEIQAPELWRISRRFVSRSVDLHIITFYECKRPGFGLPVIVSEDSAVLGLPNELAIPVAADHRALCRFSSRDSQLYKPIERAIQRLCHSILRDFKSQEDEGIPRPPTKVAAQRKWQHTEKSSSTMTPGHTKCCESTKRVDEEDITNPAEAIIRCKPPDGDRSLGIINMDIFMAKWLFGHPKKSSVAQSSDSIIINVEFIGDTQKTLHLPSSLPIQELTSHLRTNQNDESYFAFSLPESTRCIDPTWRDVQLIPAVVVSDGPRARDHQSPAIHQHEKLASFFSRVTKTNFESELRSDWTCPDKLARLISIKVSGSPAIEISFHRTLRVPEDGKAHSVPPCIGKYPLFNVCDFEDKLPRSTRDMGGVFLPIFELQALGVVFSSIGEKYAVRPFVGGVNTISGRPLPTMARLLQNSNLYDNKDWVQDYVVLSEQSRIDGIAVAPGFVSQFISTRMQAKASARKINPVIEDRKIVSLAVSSSTHTSVGRSVESQMTSEDAIGGIQLEIIPALDPMTMFFSKKPHIRSDFAAGWPIINEYDRHDVSEIKEQWADRLDPMKTPAELGFHPGDVIYMKDVRSIVPCRKKTLSDLLPESTMRTQGAKCQLTLRTHKYEAEDLGGTNKRHNYHHLFFMTLTGKKVLLYLPTWEDVQIHALKIWVEKTEGIPYDSSVLLYRSYSLQEHLTLQDYNIQPGDFILLTVRKRGGEGPPPLLYNGEELSMKVWSGREKTVAHLRLGVARELGVNREQILLLLDTGPLLDEQDIREIVFSARAQKVPFIRVEYIQDPVPDLTIGAAGIIRQTIRKDPFDPTQHWDWNNSHFLHVGLLNGVEFQRVTGVPPPSSLTIAGESERTVPHDAIAGEFGNMRTLAEFEKIISQNTEDFTAQVAVAR